MKKILAMLLALCMVFALCACGQSAAPAEQPAQQDAAPAEDAAPADETPAAEGSVYYLNFKPEQDEQWQALAASYTEQTGVPVTVVTAASGQYETTLMSEMEKSEAPTLFQVNGPTGLKNWKDYCADLSDTKLRGELIDDSLALQSDGKDVCIDWVQESFGIIYNKQLLEKAGYKAEDINSFDKLKACADDIQARKAELGVEGAFTSAGMDSSSNWRYTTHLANMPIHYEFKDENEDDTDAIKGTYLPQYKQIFDLYLTDSTCDPSQVASKTGDDAVNEFLNWVVTDDEATKAIAEDMGLTMPFKSAKEVANPLAKIAKEYEKKRRD